jgi:hypothetical protein
MTRDEWIEAGARALYGPEEDGPSLVAEQRREGCRSLAEQVIDVVEPLIQAEERLRVANRIADLCDDRAKELRARQVAGEAITLPPITIGYQRVAEMARQIGRSSGGQERTDQGGKGRTPA